jgi:hypothetical protein
MEISYLLSELNELTPITLLLLESNKTKKTESTTKIERENPILSYFRVALK